MEYLTHVIDSLRLVTPMAVAIRIFAAVIVGGLLGLERGMKNRPAGMRTYMRWLLHYYVHQPVRCADFRR